MPIKGIITLEFILIARRKYCCISKKNYTELEYLELSKNPSEQAIIILSPMLLEETLVYFKKI